MNEESLINEIVDGNERRDRDGEGVDESTSSQSVYHVKLTQSRKLPSFGNKEPMK